MTTPDSIAADVSGVADPSAPNAGAPEPWRAVAARHPRNIGDIVGDPSRGPWVSQHNGTPYPATYDAYEQQVTTAEQIAWTHKFSDGIVRDSGDVLIELMEFAIQYRTANKLPTSAGPQAPPTQAPPTQAPAPEAGKRHWKR
ncbi:MAG: hypothetical protein ACLP3C_02705 [Mycobacterium sp.]|uniref:hypothetical protein n=1 Tax=Mycobacterium sp. TaxID=1785 RepID=UPI003F96E903